MILSPTSTSDMHLRAREQQRQLFLKHHGYNPACLTFLAGDASPRQYYRWQEAGKSVILMDTPLSEKPEQFCKIAKVLCTQGLSAPAILANDLDQGFILLEDLGDLTYTQALNPGNLIELYSLAVDTLIYLQQNIGQKPSFVNDYTLAEFLREALLFLEWYYPATQGKEVSSIARRTYESLWHQAFAYALDQQPKSLVLRDYHVDNLVLLPERQGIQQCGLLDFQDALWGPVGYDLVSLLEDARRDINPALKEAMWMRYGNAFPHLDLRNIRRSGAIISAGRHLKILGIFTRLAKRDNKKEYLIHLPRVWNLLKNTLKEAEEPELTAWFEEHIAHWRLPNVN